jgi:prephenate dehydrogenase
MPDTETGSEASTPKDRIVGPVHIVGSGLLGTSIGLALSDKGIEVWLSDTNHDHSRTAVGLGAGKAAPNDLSAAQLVVIAVPPNEIADAVLSAFEDSPSAVITDVGSVKGQPLDEIADRAELSQLARYVGGHPMAGSERSGPLAGTVSLFQGRPWAVTPDVHSVESAALVEDLARLCGADVVRLSPKEHDRAVARTSHLPQLLSVLTAAQLVDALPEQLILSGQGLRDVTRIAASDPELWTQILMANREAIDELLVSVEQEIQNVRRALVDGDELSEFLNRGVDGTRAIPGKHGGQFVDTAAVFVAVPDTMGELARLFAEISEIGVNIEDLRIDHDPARDYGLVEVQVDETRAADLAEELQKRGWATHR